MLLVGETFGHTPHGQFELAAQFLCAMRRRASNPALLWNARAKRVKNQHHVCTSTITR